MKKEIEAAKKAVAAAKTALCKIYREDVVSAYFRKIDNDLEAKEHTRETTIDQPSDEDVEAINAECQAKAAADWQAILDEREAAKQEALKVPDVEGISIAEQAELMKQAQEEEAEAEKAKALAEKEAAIKAAAEAELAEAEAKALAEKEAAIKAAAEAELADAEAKALAEKDAAEAKALADASATLSNQQGAEVGTQEDTQQ